MAGQKFTSWVHGSAMTGEYLNRIASVRHCGPFVRIEGNEGQKHLAPLRRPHPPPSTTAAVPKPTPSP